MDTDRELGPLKAAVDDSLARLTRDGLVGRLFDRDPTLWTGTPEGAAVVLNRLGWLDVLGAMRGEVAALRSLPGDLRAAGIERVLLLGMGGSSLCVSTFLQVLGVRGDGIPVEVIDTTDPETVLAAGAGGLDSTAFLVASKSGGTAETSALHRHFAGRVADRSRFLAITDPDTPLHRLATEQGFGHVFVNPPDIGGRYSSLSLFGLVPLAILGAPLDEVFDAAEAMADSCRRTELSSNPGVSLGAVLAAAAEDGRDKATLVSSEGLASLGAWVEQLVAESSGKDGRGVLPIDGEPLGKPGTYGDDRLFLRLRLGAEPEPEVDEALDALVAAGHPVVTLRVARPEDVGGEMYRWEIATAVLCSLLGVNAFDEPDVRAAKEATAARLAEYHERGELPERRPVAVEGPLAAHPTARPVGGATLDELLTRHLASARVGDYFGLLAFLPDTPAVRTRLDAMRRLVRDRLRLPSSVGIGPRYLHSTGQLHLAGPDRGVFVVLTREHDEDPQIPGEDHGFATLNAAQALGAFQALRSRGRRVLRCHLTGNLDDALAALHERLDRALS